MLQIQAHAINDMQLMTAFIITVVIIIIII